MSALTWKAWIGVIVIAMAVAAVTFLGLLQVNQWRQESATLQAVVQLLNYNVAQGRLLQLPAVAPAPAPVAEAPVPEPAPPVEVPKP